MKQEWKLKVFSPGLIGIIHKSCETTPTFDAGICHGCKEPVPREWRMKKRNLAKLWLDFNES